ncbi:MAG: MFS transporter [Acidimicrobiales bacterium]|nr:MFS transporter [Acidimicrobiales bacterium]
MPTTSRRTRPDLTFVSIVAVSAFYMFGFAAVFALLPKLQDEHGLETKWLGLITATSVLCSVAAQLGLARFADRGHALRMMRAGIVCMVVGFTWFAFATELWQFAAARAVVGFGGGMFSPSARRTIVSRDPASAGALLGTMVSVEVGGFMLGPPLALVLFGIGGLQLPFLVPAVLVGLAGCTVRVAAAASVPTITPKGAVRALLARPQVRAALLVASAANLSIGAFEPIIARQLEDIGAGDTAIALTLAGFAVPYVFFSRFGGRLADRHGAYRTAVWSMLLTVPVIATFGIATSALVIGVFGVVRSMFDTITAPSGSSAMAHAAPSALLGTGQGLYGATAQVMTGVAALAGAPIYDVWGARALWFISAGSMLVLTLWAAWIALRSGVWHRAPTRPADEAPLLPAS